MRFSREMVQWIIYELSYIDASLLLPLVPPFLPRFTVRLRLELFRKIATVTGNLHLEDGGGDVIGIHPPSRRTILKTETINADR